MKQSVFDPSDIPPVPVTAEDAMRAARQRLAQRVAAQAAADKAQPDDDDDFEQRLTTARAAVAPAEPVAYCFVPRSDRFAISAITAADLEPR